MDNIKIVVEKLSQLQKDLDNALTEIGEEVLHQVDDNFRSGGFYGHKWKPKKDGSPSNLIKSGRLRRGISYYIRGNRLYFTTDTEYGLLHNEGTPATGIKQTVKQHFRRITRGPRRGQGVLVRGHTRRMRMPKRQFIGKHYQLVKAIRDMIEERVNKYF